MEHRAILAVLLSIAFFAAWNYFIIKKRMNNIPLQVVEKSNIETKTSEKETGTDKIAAESEIVTRAEVADESKRHSLNPSLTVPQEEENIRDVNVQTNLVNITFTNKGGLIKNLRLKKHLDDNKNPLDIVEHDTPGKLPLYIEFDDPEMSEFVNNIVFEASTDSLFISKSNPREELSFTYKDTYGFKISKILTFYYDRYQIDIRTIIEDGHFIANNAFYRLLWGPGIYSGLKEKGRYSFEGATTFINDESINNKPDKVTDYIIHQGNLSWTALQNKFFVAVFVPKGDSPSKAIVKKEEDGKLSVGLQYNISGSKADNQFMLFAGPKEFERIRSYNVKLERLIDYGMIGNTFKFLVRPLFMSLKIFYRFFHNYGVAIIILTVLIKALFLPLSQKSYTSMEKMKKLQPQMKIMQERYKDDKQKLNEEMMRFYKENKVNPFGGCLPMLLQIPVFFALYNVLLHSVELRHAPFIFWIQDLSVKDPLYITPILMGVTMLIQQRMTPSTGDPTQAKLMMFMPVIFTVMFLNFPVGLVIYWLINNVMTIGQQYLIAKKNKA